MEMETHDKLTDTLRDTRRGAQAPGYPPARHHGHAEKQARTQKT